MLRMDYILLLYRRESSRKHSPHNCHVDYHHECVPHILALMFSWSIFHLSIRDFIWVLIWLGSKHKPKCLPQFKCRGELLSFDTIPVQGSDLLPSLMSQAASTWLISFVKNTNAITRGLGNSGQPRRTICFIWQIQRGCEDAISHNQENIKF